MGAQDNSLTKKRGRPATGQGHVVGVRMQPELLAQLDEFITTLPDPQPTRPEAIRQIVQAFLGPTD